MKLQGTVEYGKSEMCRPSLPTFLSSSASTSSVVVVDMCRGPFGVNGRPVSADQFVHFISNSFHGEIHENRQVRRMARAKLNPKFDIVICRWMLSHQPPIASVWNWNPSRWRCAVSRIATEFHAHFYSFPFAGAVMDAFKLRFSCFRWYNSPTRAKLFYNY